MDRWSASRRSALRRRNFGNLSCVASIAFHRGGVDPVNHELDRDVITIGRAPFVASGSRI